MNIGIRSLRYFGFAALWALTALMMSIDYVRDPYNGELEGTDAYGHNGQNALLYGIIISAVELVCLYAIVRPWSYQRSWRRALFALVCFAPWTVFSLVMAIHAGGVTGIHAFWLVSVVALLVVLALVAGVSNALRIGSRETKST